MWPGLAAAPSAVPNKLMKIPGNVRNAQKKRQLILVFTANWWRWHCFCFVGQLRLAEEKNQDLRLIYSLVKTFGQGFCVKRVDCWVNPVFVRHFHVGVVEISVLSCRVSEMTVLSYIYSRRSNKKHDCILQRGLFWEYALIIVMTTDVRNSNDWSSSCIQCPCIGDDVPQCLTSFACFVHCEGAYCYFTKYFYRLCFNESKVAS